MPEHRNVGGSLLATSKLPICHLNLAPSYRGGERQTELLIRELSRRGRPQRLVVRNGNSLAARCADVSELDIHEVASNPVAAGLAIRGSAVAHSHEGRTPYSCLFARYAFGIPYVITRRVVAPQKKSFLRSLAYDRAGRVATVSKAASDELKKRMPLLEPVVVADATAGFKIDHAVAEHIRAKRAGKVLIGNVGALDHSHKGQSTIIEAARLVAESHPDWHFMLCGDGKDRDRFRQEMAGLTNVELVGWVDNVGDYLASFDVFAYPSLHEALGSSILDAMQLGLPVVASNVGGIPDFVESGVHGELFEPEDARGLIEGLEAVLADPEKRRAMGERGIEQAAAYSVTRMADAYETLYREIAA